MACPRYCRPADRTGRNLYDGRMNSARHIHDSQAAAHPWQRRAAAVVSLLCMTLLAGCASLGGAQFSAASGTQFALETRAGDATLFFDMQGMLWALPAAGGTAQALTGLEDDLRNMRLSPDGTRLVAQSFRRGVWDLVLLDRNGATLQVLTNGPHDHRDPTWSTDGTRIYFATDRSGNYDIWSLELNSGALEQLTTDPADDFGPTVVGDTLVFVSTRNRSRALYQLELRTPARPQKIPRNDKARVYAPRLSPDGTQLAYVESRERNGFPGVAINQAVVLELATGEVTVVSAPTSDVFSQAPTWAGPSTVLFGADGQIQRVDIERRELAPVPFRAALRTRRAAYTRQPPIALTQREQPALGIVDPALLGDDSIVFTALGDLWRQFPDGRLQQLTDDAYIERDVDVSPDGEWLTYISDRPGTASAGTQIWLHNLRTQVVTRLTDDAAGPRYPTYAPDGTRIAYLDVGPRGVQDFTLRVVTLANRTTQRLRSAPRVWPGRLAWSADSEHVTVAELVSTSARFGSGKNRLVRVNVATDTATPLDIGTLVPDFGPAASADGSALALVVDGTLWQLDVQPDGSVRNRPVQLLDTLLEAPRWSPNGRSLVALTNRGLETLTVDPIQSRIGARRVRNPALNWSPRAATATTLIHAGRVFTGSGDAYLTDVDILIEGSRIVGVYPHTAHPPQTRLIDAATQTVLPGLIDHHVHFEPHKGELLGRSLLAFGVTTVVEPGGLPYESREQMESWLSGRRPGPRLVFAGPQLDGDRKVFHFATHVTSPERLQREFVRADRLGYGMIKTYTRLAPDLQRETVELAHARGLPVSAHAAFRNVGNGGDRIEHLRGSSRLEHAAKQSAWLKTYDDLEALLSAAPATVTPTLVNQGGYFNYLLEHPELADTPQYLELYTPTYRQSLAAFTNIVARRRALVASGVRHAQDSISRLAAADVRIVAGTDSPIFPYGLALVVELANYAEAGLSNADTLRTATVNAAAELGAADSLGQIAPGFLADLVIVDGDPLRSLTELTNVTGVMVNGHFRNINELLWPDPDD